VESAVMKKITIISALLCTLIETSFLQAGPTEIKVLNRSGSRVEVKTYKQVGGLDYTGYLCPNYKVGSFPAVPPDRFTRVEVTKEDWSIWKPRRPRFTGQSIRFDIPETRRNSITVVFNGTNLVELSEYWKEQQQESTANYFQKLSAQLAVGERFAKTKSWLSDIWTAIRTTIANLVTRPAPAVDVTPTPAVQQQESLTPSMLGQQEALISWLDILQGKLGDEYLQKAQTIGLHYHIKANAPDFKKEFDALFFAKDSKGKIITYHRVPIEDAKKQINETIRILNEYKTQGLIQ
jgi:hypothetical protein